MDWTTLISLTEHLAWPLTVVASLLIFKRNISGVFNRLGSFSAGAQGVSLNFVEEKIAVAKNVLKGISPNSQAKSAEIQVSLPYQRLKKMEHQLHERLVEKASTNNIPSQGRGSLELADQLKDVGIISFQEFKLLQAFMDIETAADHQLTGTQLSEIEEIYNAIKL